MVSVAFAFSPVHFKIGNNLDNLKKQLLRGARATRSRFFCSEEHLFFILRSEIGTGELTRAPKASCFKYVVSKSSEDSTVNYTDASAVGA